MTEKETLQFLTDCLPRPVGRALIGANGLYELRVRAERPVELLTREGERSCAYTPTQEQVNTMAEALSERALYARAEEQRQGFVTLRGGHRMGLCGRVISQGSTVRALREISSFCLRVAGQWAGTADRLRPYWTDEAGRLRSLLVIGPPASGKTTLLRDACRQLSDGGKRMTVADERSELAAAYRGVPQLDVGSRTDVLDGCCKDVAIHWLLRSMSPDAIVTDELGSPSDAQAVLDALQSGVAVLASVHGRSTEQTLSRGMMYQLAQRKAFGLYAVMDEKRVGQIAELYDANMTKLA